MGAFLVKLLPIRPATRQQHIPSKVHSDEHTGLSDATTHGVSAGVFHPDLALVSGPGTRGCAHDGATNRHQPASHRSVSGAGAWLFFSSGVCPAPMVDLGPRSGLDHVPAGPGGSVRAGAAGGRRYGHRAPGPPRVWQGPASRWGTLDPQLYRLSLGAYVGRRVGAREAALRDTPVGPPPLGGFVPSPRGGLSGVGFWETGSKGRGKTALRGPS